MSTQTVEIGCSLCGRQFFRGNFSSDSCTLNLFNRIVVRVCSTCRGGLAHREISRCAGRKIQITLNQKRLEKSSGANFNPAGANFVPTGANFYFSAALISKLAPVGVKLAPFGLKLAPFGLKLAPVGPKISR